MENNDMENLSDLEQHEAHEAFTKSKEYLQNLYKCSEPEATAFLIQNKKEIGDLYNLDDVTAYCGQEDTAKKFEEFRKNFALYHEKTQ